MLQKLNLITSGIKPITLILLALSFLVSPVYANEAENLGVYQGVATPKVVSVDDIVFKTGEVGYVHGVIKNIGSERGRFETRVECDGKISMIGSSYSCTLEGGQEEHVTIGVTGGVVSGISCEFITRVMDKEDLMSFTATVAPIQFCTPGRQICMGGISETCRADGTGWFEDGDNERCENLHGENILKTIPGLKIFSVLFLICLVSIFIRRKR